MSVERPQPDLSSVPHFATEGALRSWLREKGVEHLSRLSLTVLVPWVDAALLPQARPATARRRLVEMLSEEARTRWAQESLPSPKMKELLPRLAWRFVEEERRGAERTRAELAARLSPPDDPRTHRVHGLLLDLRSRAPDTVAPRPTQALFLEPLQHDPELPGFRFRETRCSELPYGAQMGFILPEATLTFTPNSVQADCTCGAPPCVHVLAAIDTVLLWLHQPWTPSFGETLEELVRPGWDRTLRAMERALDDGTGSGAGVEISWRVDVIEGYGVEVFPYVHKRNKKGLRSTGAKVSRRKLLQEHGSQLSALDARLASLLPDGDAPVSRGLLIELVDHPRLYQEGTQDLLVQVERAKVGIVAVERGGTVIVTAGVDGATLHATMVDRVRKSKPEEALFLWDEGARRLTVLDVGPEVRALVTVLQRHGNVFPPESHEVLLEKLSKLAVRMPVALPRGVMGERVPSLQLPVLRFELEPGGAVRVELRMRALPDSISFVPGEGPRDVYVRRNLEPVHTVRDFMKELALAQSLQARLPFAQGEAQVIPFTFSFEGVQGALALLSACQELESPPELEWVGSPLKLAGSRGASALRITVERKRDWFGVLGGLAVQGERVELGRLLDAARRKERFIQVKDQTYVEVEEALRHHLERLADHAHLSRHGLEVSPAAAESLSALGTAGATLDADETWKRLVERIFAAKELKPKVPATLKTELRDYQADGFRWLTRLASWGAGGVLADDMGLGKTVQALTVLLERSKLGPALVLAPTSVAFNWMDEAKRFAPSLRMRLFSEAADRGGLLERLGPRDVLVLSYGLLTRDIGRLSELRFATIVFDEAQALKNAGTHRFRAARALQGDFKFALSGTPLENHLGELWSVFALVFPGLLGSHDAFRTRFAIPIERRVDPTAAPALARVLEPFLLRRTKAQVEAQLPPRTDVRVPVVLSTAEWTMYEDARLAALSALESRPEVKQERRAREHEQRFEVLAALTRLRLLASHPRLYDATSRVESSKLERFLELVEELRAEGHRALVFSQFTSHLALVREVLDARGIRYEYLDGQSTPKAREQSVRAFQEGTAPLFLISLKAGGFGLNLTAANSVIHLDPWWNPAVEDQASDRAHRIGQDRPVTVYRLVARGTIEEQMLSLHEHKRALVADVLEGKDGAGRLSTQEMLGLLSQRLSRPDEEEPPQTRH
ncbi:SNF2/helicase domain-containing protein [Myxococcus stipitatus DSM 14675]|uniref:SNF2/helicase domain-containing protein n=1 Tax=Myxococcus stipitatus (strain DSM 14675 / JCM 12634 / Mx s8) TaxID=1278073 RepID=L7U8H2_MYXSD|nr:DEAD/DEAH box helicase [Myxococcus stipitatus]AGC45226.1 SNF2/helicase domain-containing protein [Myxococcus stipitatus DSM 14675]